MCVLCVYARAYNDVRVQAELYRANQIQPTEAGTGAPPGAADDSQRANAARLLHWREHGQ